MEGETWLTLADLSRRLSRAESTVRHWRDIYRDLIPSQTRADGLTVWPLSAFARIREMAEQRYTPREIRRELAEGAAGSPPTSDRETLSEILTAMHKQIETLERIERLLERIVGPED